MTHHTHTIIIGAGIAGLTAAMHLTRAGTPTVVLEARQRVGGRAHSAHTPHGTFDLGATWFWDNEPRVGAAVTTLDAGSFPQFSAGVGVLEGPGSDVQLLPNNPMDSGASRFANGAQHLANRLAAVLPSGAVHLGTVAREIVLTGGGVEVRAGDELFVGEHVILAVPPALAVDTIHFDPPLPNDVGTVAGRTAVWMGQMVKAVAVYDHPFWRDSGLAGSGISYRGPFREFHDHSDPEHETGAIFGFAPSHLLRDVNEMDIAGQFTKQLARYFGEGAALPRAVHVLDWARERYTSPEPRVAAAGSTDTFGAAVFQVPSLGRIHWASTETATMYAGHVEGAMLAGARTAAAIAP